MPSWLLAGSGRDPATQQLLEHVLPSGRLPSDRDGAIALAAELVFEEVLTAIAADVFLKQNVHPAYRESVP